MRIAFVILNLNSLEVTCNCIRSLRDKIRDQEFYIVVVDNGSSDSSGNIIRDIFSEESNIKVILNEKNLGFSKGLNVGYKYAKYELNCDYIALINNDTVLLSDNICSIIEEDYVNYNFAVLGPHIDTYNTGSPNKNPYHGVEKNPREMRRNLYRMRRILKRELALSVCGALYIYELLRQIYHIFIPRIDPYKGLEKENQKEKVVLNTGLHGCFWILSPLYVEKYDGLDEITFIYVEEWFLYINCLEEKMCMMYDPRIRIFHSEHMYVKKSAGSVVAAIRKRNRIEIKAINDSIKYIDNRWGKNR